MIKSQTDEIQKKFNVKVNNDWSFAGNRSVEHLTHGYHRYPAKFIPQVVKKLLETYVTPGDRVADVFAGCGTTLVECKVHGFNSIGVDINPVAQLITNAKINPVKPELLQSTFIAIMKKVEGFDPQMHSVKLTHPRIDYWFRPEEKEKISFLYKTILKIENSKSRDFFLCALSNILKNCSKWLQDSTKPQIDPEKKPVDPFISFNAQVKKMLKRNSDFYERLKEDGTLNTSCKIKLADARKTRLKANSVNAIITSPPYVTSYEYADIHQLTGYWFEYISDMGEFRKKFIGTFYSQNEKLVVRSSIATEIISQLSKKNPRIAREVANYFNSMTAVAKEMNRILAPKGVVCLLVGNTTLRNVKIK
jgi:DNA modification methylase